MAKYGFENNLNPSNSGELKCSISSPPWWYDEAPDANIDMGIGFLIVVGLIIGVITIYIKR